jgi:hypothetical protein
MSARVEGAGRKAVGAMVDTARETIQKGIGKIGQQAGKGVGLGLSAAAAWAFEAAGHDAPSVVTGAAMFAGAAAGDFVQKVLTAGFPAGGVIDRVMADLTRGVRAVKAADDAAAQVEDVLRGLHDRLRRTARGSRRLEFAVVTVDRAIRTLADGRGLASRADHELGEALHLVARGG